jgi:hypothetical protein
MRAESGGMSLSSQLCDIIVLSKSGSDAKSVGFPVQLFVSSGEGTIYRNTAVQAHDDEERGISKALSICRAYGTHSLPSAIAISSTFIPRALFPALQPETASAA